MNITLTGNLGSGKTSVCNELKKMGYNIISAGSIFRSIADEKNMSVIELNKLAETDRSIDDLIDNRSAKLGQELDNTVFDSRLAWHFIPDSFKVFLLVDTEEAAKRVFNGENRNAEAYLTLDDATKGLTDRATLERERFKELYNIDYYDASNYNLIIESTNASPEEVAKEIIRNFEKYKEHNFPTKVELNISNIYPSQRVRDFNNDALDYWLKEETDNSNLCAIHSIPIIDKDNFYYMLDGHHKTFMAARTGKKFVEVNFQNDISSKNAVSQNCVPQHELYDFEDLGKFIYNKYPDKDNRIAYALDFKKLDGPSFDFINEEKIHSNDTLEDDTPEL